MSSLRPLIPHDCNYFTQNVQFKATFNSPVIGKYSFSNVAANTAVTLFDINTTSVYLIGDMIVSGNIPISDYHDITEVLPSVRFGKAVTDEKMWAYPIPLARYTNGQEVDMFLWSEQGEDALTLSCTGLMGANANLVGVSEIILNVAFNIYEIGNQHWVQNFKDDLHKSAGSKLRF